jgi:hypothetical protein
MYIFSAAQTPNSSEVIKQPHGQEIHVAASTILQLSNRCCKQMYLQD